MLEGLDDETLASTQDEVRATGDGFPLRQSLFSTTRPARVPGLRHNLPAIVCGPASGIRSRQTDEPAASRTSGVDSGVPFEMHLDETAREVRTMKCQLHARRVTVRL